MTWEELYALLCVETGWTWEYVDEEMTLPRCDAFIGLWKVAPPVSVTLHVIAKGLGVMGEEKGAAKKKAVPVQQESIGNMIEEFAAAGIQIEKRSRNG